MSPVCWETAKTARALALPQDMVKLNWDWAAHTHTDTRTHAHMVGSGEVGGPARVRHPVRTKVMIK